MQGFSTAGMHVSWALLGIWSIANFPSDLNIMSRLSHDPLYYQAILVAKGIQKTVEALLLHFGTNCRMKISYSAQAL